MDKNATSLLDSLRRIMRALRTSSRQSESDVGLSVAQFFVLQQLGAHAPLSVNELAEKTYSHQSTVSVVVLRLAELGLVTRTPAETDRRRMILQLTPQGQELVSRRKQTIQENFVAALHGLEPTEQEQLAILLEKFVAKAGLAGEPPHFFFEKEENALPASLEGKHSANV